MARDLVLSILSPRPRPGPFGASLMSALARLVLASVLVPFFLTSFLTKIDGFGLSDGAYYQILPRMFEATGYDATALAWPWHMVVAAGTLTEAVLPLMVVLGLATRPAALGMLGFVAVMTLTDIFGHGVGTAAIGLPFDADPSGMVADQRLMWAALLAVPLWLGGGALSLDALIWPRLERWCPGLAAGRT